MVHFFGYRSLSAGQNFNFTLETNNTNLDDEIIKILNGKLRLRRSRSAEYGLVEITKTNNLNERVIQNNKNLTIWLLSDIALQDCKEDDESWSTRVVVENIKIVDFRTWLKCNLEEIQENPDFIEIIARLAHNIRAKLIQNEKK
jgi:hypothetical protein